MEIKVGELQGNLFNSMRARFGFTIALDQSTVFTFQELINQLIKQGEDISLINAFIEHINENSSLYIDGDINLSGTSNKWPSTGSELSNELFCKKNINLIDKTTPIVSMGSCFAIEIAKWLQYNHYNYVVTETNLDETGSVHCSSAKWGTIYNSAGFYQVIKWAYGLSKPSIVCYQSGDRYRDAFREDIVYSEAEVDNLQNIWGEHVKKSREALDSAKILILTVGLNEVFEYLPTGDYLHRNPWTLNPSVYKRKILSVEENLNFLQLGVDILNKHNPDIKFIVSVSPVPLLRSFSKKNHVSAATSHSKSIIRVALEYLANNNHNVYYMPSFETVMYPGNSLSVWDNDGRHVSKQIVNKIMNVFQATFCGVDGLLMSSWWIPELIPKKASNIFSDIDIKIINKTLHHLIDKEIINIRYAIEIINKIKISIHMGTYSETTYFTLRHLNFSTGFQFSNFARKLYRDFFKSQNSNHIRIKDAVELLDNDGYIVIESDNDKALFADALFNQLSSCNVSRAIDKKEGLLSKMSSEDIKDSFRYYHLVEDLPFNDIIRFLEENNIIEIVEAYLGRPILKSVNVWHSIPPSQSTEFGNVAAAQRFHHDNDNPLGWVKIFVYLTDVDSNSGPHEYVPTSHKIVHESFRRDGRFTDLEVLNKYGLTKEITGKKGTIIIGDTQCLHKGKEPTKGSRTCLQLEFCNSLIGAEYNSDILAFWGNYHSRASDTSDTLETSMNTGFS